MIIVCLDDIFAEVEIEVTNQIQEHVLQYPLYCIFAQILRVRCLRVTGHSPRKSLHLNMPHIFTEIKCEVLGKWLSLQSVFCTKIMRHVWFTATIPIGKSVINATSASQYLYQGSRISAEKEK